MRVALIGITGQVGSRRSAELLTRGHRITGIARHPEKAAAQSGLVLEQGDATNSSTPSAEFVPGKRTGKFRLGGDDLLVDANGRSWISMEDYAIALVDELENTKHVRQRFTIGY